MLESYIASFSNHCIILMARQSMYNPLEKYPYHPQMQSPSQIEKFSSANFMKIANFMKTPRLPMLEGDASYDTVKSKPRYSFNGFMAKVRCGLKKKMEIP